MSEQRTRTSKEPSSFIFNIEVLIEDNHHASALEQLIRSLNSCGFSDYSIRSGIQLGQLIEQRKSIPSSIQPVPIDNIASASAAADPRSNSSSDTPHYAAGAGSDSSTLNGFDNIRTFMKNNSLIRLIVNKGLGIIMNIPCRVINIDEHEHLITVYHVDEKQVYTFRLNEIEDFIE